MGWGTDIYKLARIVVKRPCKGYYLRWYYNGWHYWFFLPGEIKLLTEGEDYNTIGTRKIVMASGQVNESQIEALRTIMNTRQIALYTDKGWMAIRIDTGSVVVQRNQVSGYDMTFVTTVGSRESYYTPIASVPVIPPDTPDPDACEITIGTQVWACKNYDGNFPGSKVYNDDEANRDLYGGLYSQDQVNTVGFAPPGWHVPTKAEWQELIDFVGRLVDAGGELKDIGFDYWIPPNTDAADTYGFSARGGGFYGYTLPADRIDYFWLTKYGYFWAAAEGGKIPFYVIRYDTATVIPFELDPPTPPYTDSWMSVRLIKDGPFVMPEEIEIGMQTWKTINHTEAYVGSLPANGDAGNDADYGRLYSHAMLSLITIPAGWRVPTLDDVDVLIGFVGGKVGNAGKLKEVGTEHWDAPNTGATNLHSFYGRAAGNATAIPFYANFGTHCDLWLLDKDIVNSGQKFGLQVNVPDISTSNHLSLSNYFAVRLIKDETNAIVSAYWHLPSLDALQAMYDNLHLSGLGGFRAIGYWSSTEHNRTNAYAINFLNGFNSQNTKSSGSLVRPVRAFTTTQDFTIGDLSPFLNYIFEKVNNGDGTYTYYEVASADLVTQQWSDQDSVFLSTTLSDIDEGLSNTYRIISQPDLGVSAARSCRDTNP